jgi:hypothetical protein
MINLCMLKVTSTAAGGSLGTIDITLAGTEFRYETKQ